MYTCNIMINIMVKSTHLHFRNHYIVCEIKCSFQIVEYKTTCAGYLDINRLIMISPILSLSLSTCDGVNITLHRLQLIQSGS